MMETLLETDRIQIAKYDLSFVQSGLRLSQEATNRKYIPDEVFETEEDARKCTEFLIQAYQNTDGPFVYPLIQKAGGEHIGHIQACRIGKAGWEVGYHIGEAFEGQGLATEAVKAFVPYIMGKLKIHEIYGICWADNFASRRVLEKSGFVFTEEVERTDENGQCRFQRRYVYRKE